MNRKIENRYLIYSSLVLAVLGLTIFIIQLMDGKIEFSGLLVMLAWFLLTQLGEDIEAR